ncbi:hypothetical protein [Dyadobacter luticola]|uniref:DUF4293 family protein n=1 Tax=Dyadobacter luticola TaxID=1979387 RepID=A0A5R9L3I9_9BACT|nr:hypothetical protein [Dyadobacter luticola]TLV02855.1 hypothetical protein FEN17_04370 [Dyadobacter luticola]
MNRKLTSLILLLVLSVTDAYLLAHPNLIGKIGILVYKHSYIQNFPRALVTVALVVAVSLLICEGSYRFLSRRISLGIYGTLTAVALVWFMYVYITFSSFSYRITGKAFIYGAHLLPVILMGLYTRYFLKRILIKEDKNTAVALGESAEKSRI